MVIRKILAVLIMMSVASAAASAATIIRMEPSEIVMEPDETGKVEGSFNIVLETDEPRPLRGFQIRLALSDGSAINWKEASVRPESPIQPGAVFQNNIDTDDDRVFNIFGITNAAANIPAGNANLVQVDFEIEAGAEGSVVSVDFLVDNPATDTALADAQLNFFMPDVVGGQIQITPEPSSAMLLALMGLPLLRATKRTLA